MITVDFSENIAASDLKGSRSRHLIEYMKMWGIKSRLEMTLTKFHRDIICSFLRKGI